MIDEDKIVNWWRGYKDMYFKLFIIIQQSWKICLYWNNSISKKELNFWL